MSEPTVTVGEPESLLEAVARLSRQSARLRMEADRYREEAEALSHELAMLQKHHPELANMEEPPVPPPDSP